MYTASVRALRADLATAVRRAGAGESTVVTVHGRPMATLGPITPAHPGAVTLDQLLASGAALPARRRVPWRPAEPVSVWTGTRIDLALREIRG